MKESAHRPIVRCECRRQWRDWLAGHFESESEVWFVFPTKDSGEEGVSYNDAVPGLWNGAMSDWNTLFVEVPLETFNPVKVVLDLLRPAHQA